MGTSSRVVAIRRMSDSGVPGRTPSGSATSRVAATASRVDGAQGWEIVLLGQDRKGTRHVQFEQAGAEANRDAHDIQCHGFIIDCAEAHQAIDRFGKVNAKLYRFVPVGENLPGFERDGHERPCARIRSLKE